MFRIGFDCQKYIELQSRNIVDRISRFNKLYIEFGGKLFDDYHASRVLPGFEPDTKIKMLLAHPASAGYGLNLQEGGHIMAWYGLPWSLEQYLQAVARLQRQGQKYPVMVYHIIAKGTVDEQVMKSLQKKDITQSALIGILKDRKQGYK